MEKKTENNIKVLEIDEEKIESESVITNQFNKFFHETWDILESTLPKSTQI